MNQSTNNVFYLSYRISDIRRLWVAANHSHWTNEYDQATDVIGEVWRIDSSHQHEQYVVAFDSWINGLWVRLESHSIEWRGEIPKIFFEVSGDFDKVVRALRKEIYKC